MNAQPVILFSPIRKFKRYPPRKRDHGTLAGMNDVSEIPVRAAFYGRSRLQGDRPGDIMNRLREVRFVETIDVGKRVKSIRKRKNLTLQEVSEKSGVSATAISAIERNVSSPTVNTLASIGRALGESLSSLLGEAEIEYVVTRAANRERLAPGIPNGDFQSLAHGVPGQRFHP